MQQTGAHAASDRRQGLAGAVTQICHQPVGVACLDEPPLDFGPVQLPSSHELAKAERL
jgi:hypothetical protein